MYVAIFGKNSSQIADGIKFNNIFKTKFVNLSSDEKLIGTRKEIRLYSVPLNQYDYIAFKPQLFSYDPVEH